MNLDEDVVERVAKLVGTILHATQSGSERMVDAHVVAVCAGSDSALGITSDPDDMAAQSAAVPGTRILARGPLSLGAA